MRISIQSALFAGISAQLYGFVKAQESYSAGTSGTTKDWILALCYGSIFLNLGATVIGMSIANKLGGVQFRKRSSAPNLMINDDGFTNGLYRILGLSESDFLLERYSEGAITKAVLLHCT